MPNIKTCQTKKKKNNTKEDNKRGKDEIKMIEPPNFRPFNHSLIHTPSTSESQTQAHTYTQTHLYESYCEYMLFA